MKTLSFLFLSLVSLQAIGAGLTAWEKGQYLYIQNPAVEGRNGGPLVIKVKIPPDHTMNRQTRHMQRCENREYIEKHLGRYRLRYAITNNTNLQGKIAPLSSEVVFNKFKKAIAMIEQTDLNQEIETIPNPILQYCPFQSDDPSYFDWNLWEKSGKQEYLINVSDVPLRKGKSRLATLLVHEFSHAYDYLRGIESPKKKYGLEHIISQGECVAYMKQLHAINQLGGYDSDIRRVTSAMLIPQKFKIELARNLKSYKHCDLFREHINEKEPGNALFSAFEENGSLDTAKILPKLTEWNRSFIRRKEF